MSGNLTKTLGTITGAIIFAIGWALNFTQNPILPPQVISAVGFIFVVGFLGWTIFDLNKEIKSLTDAKPSIKVEPVKMRDLYGLRVTNTGEEAVFEAHISLEQGDPNVYSLSEKPYYVACWDNAQKYQATIKKGLSANIKLAELNFSPPPSFNFLTWHLFYCANDNQEYYARASSYPMGAYYEDKDGNKTPYEPLYRYRLHIIISATPSLREGVFEDDYLISYQHHFERLAPDKKGSQPERIPE